MATARPTGPSRAADWSIGYTYAPTPTPHPFPGMDPFIESQKWETTHHALAEAIAEFISPQLPDGYVCSSEDGVRLLTPNDGGGFRDVGRRVPDAFVAGPSSATATISLDELAPDSVFEAEHAPLYSVVVRSADGEIVTWIELLSPGNKDEAGARLYQAKRDTILATSCALLEIDLTHQHGKLAEAQDLSSRYYALLNVPRDRAAFLRYELPLHDPLRTLKVPVTNATVNLDLQEVVNRVYARRQMDRAVDYNHVGNLGMTTTDLAWTARLVEQWRANGGRDLPLRQPR